MADCWSKTILYKKYQGKFLCMSYNKIIKYVLKIDKILNFKVGLSPSKKYLCYLLYWNSFKDHEKWFLSATFYFILKTCSQNI